MADTNHTDDPIEISGTEARGGSTPKMTRYILGFSLVLVIAVFVLIYLGFGW